MEVTKNSCWEFAKRIKFDMQKRRSARLYGDHSLPLDWLVILWFNGNYFFDKQYKKRTMELLITTAGVTF
jgi:hypothetical protein